MYYGKNMDRIENMENINIKLKIICGSSICKNFRRALFLYKYRYSSSQVEMKIGDIAWLVCQYA